MKQHYLLLSITVSSMAIFNCYSPVQKYARSYNRNQFEMRPVKITDRSFGHADASVLFEIGNTKVLCTVSLTDKAFADWCKDRWWLTATYTLLPHATNERNALRSSLSGNERAIEIARFIGRSLRSSLDIFNTAEARTIYVDCTVLQADGGTRTACITAGSIALQLAQKKWLAQGYIKKTYCI